MHNCASCFFVRFYDGLSFMTSGIWHSKQAQDADITAVDVNTKKTVVAMGDSQGYISMFRYPCTKKGVSCYAKYVHIIMKIM